MSSGVISITDAMYERMLGREASDELVRAKARSRPRQPLPLEQELAIRAARVEELQRGAHSPVGEWPNVGRWTKPRPTPPRSTTTPAWSKPRPSQPREEYPWSVTLHKRATRPFRINLLGDVSRHMLAEMADAMPDGLETGGLLLSWSRPRRDFTEIVYASGAGVRGQLHGPRSMTLPLEADLKAAMPDFLDAEAMVAVGDWHCHPHSGNSKPSRADLNSWASVLHTDRSIRRHLSTWATIIMVPAGPLGPRFFGYIIRYEGQDGRYTCEPASVEGRYVE